LSSWALAVSPFAAYGIGSGDEVVDVGCATGLTTREAAGAAAPGRVVGVDVFERVLERAVR
jgi:ubiquinone/menaquinone biosynthesis C-methylase UbiE